ncbi:MAG TPA: DUF2723 domain-containing protein [bacterium]|nr:DUF2723 domain-containing protein [bacterium]
MGSRTRHLVWLVVPLAFVVYLLTLSPTVGLIDSGELAAGCHLMNILHPTGYPLYTMLGRIVSLIPVANVANRVAVLSAVLAACGVGFFLLLGLRLGVSRVVAGTGALLLGFSCPVWSAAVDVEVYALALVMVVLLWLTAEASMRGGPLLVVAYLMGLALTNHMSATSTVLGAAMAAVLAYRRELVRRIPVLVLLFVFGMSPYLFLVLRARAGPLLAWDNPVDITHLIRHMTGWQYQVWMFSQPFGEVMRNAGRGTAILARGFLYVLVPVVLYGVARLFRQRRSLAIGLTVSAVAAFLYAINYSIPDIDSYYIPCLVVLGVFGMVGLDGLVTSVECRVSNVGPAARTIVRQVPWLLGIAALVLNYKVAGLQGDYVAYDQAMNTLVSAGHNATIITDWWDVYSPLFYLQHVEQVRPDVCVIDKELLRRSWYFDYLARAYPWLVQRSQTEIASYRQYLDEFEHDRLKDPAEIQRRYIRLLESFVTHSPERPAYTTFDVDAGTDAGQMLSGVPRAPVGLLFQIQASSLKPQAPDSGLAAGSALPVFDYTKLTVRLPRSEPDARTREILLRYRFFVMRRAAALAASGHRDEIQPLIEWYQSLPVARLAPLTSRG